MPEKTHIAHIITVRIDRAFNTYFVRLFLIETVFDEKANHLEKNRQLEMKPIAQNIRTKTSLTVMVISPKLRLYKRRHAPPDK